MASFARSINPIVHPDDNYVHFLAGFIDFTKTESYCNHAGGKALTFLVVAMHGLFNNPKRISRYSQSRQKALPSNVLEQRLYDVFMREKCFAAKTNLRSQSLSCKQFFS